MPELFTKASGRKGWKKISAESSLMSLWWPAWSRDWTELNHVDWWNSQWFEPYSSIQVRVICLFALQLMSLIITEHVQLLTLKAWFRINQFLLHPYALACAVNMAATLWDFCVKYYPNSYHCHILIGWSCWVISGLKHYLWNSDVHDKEVQRSLQNGDIRCYN